jgi:hypothetical protein
LASDATPVLSDTDRSAWVIESATGVRLDDIY